MFILTAVFLIEPVASIANLLEQKQRYGVTDLKIYLGGLRLNGPDDQAIRSLGSFLKEDTLVQLAENLSRLTDEIPFQEILNYSTIGLVDPEVAIDIGSRCTDFSCITVDRPVQNIERFLALLNQFPNIVGLTLCRNQLQELFDRLPEHSVLQRLTIYGEPSDLEFLRGMKHLNYLEVSCSIDAELIRKIFNEITTPFCLFFQNSEINRSSS